MFSRNFLLGAATFHCLCKSINFHSKLKLARISKLKTMGDLWSAAGGGLAALYLRLDILEIMLANHPYISWIEREKLWSQSGCHENPEWLHLKKQHDSWLIPWLNFLCFEPLPLLYTFPRSITFTTDLIQSVKPMKCLRGISNPRKSIY